MNFFCVGHGNFFCVGMEFFLCWTWNFFCVVHGISLLDMESFFVLGMEI